MIASASHSEYNSPPALALDGNPATRWTTGAAMTPGMWFQIDMERTVMVAGLTFNCGESPNDFPRGYRVDVSTDGAAWLKVSEGGGGVGSSSAWPAVAARYIRIVQLGNSNWWWSIHEISLGFIEVPKPLPTPPTPPALTEAEARALVTQYAKQFAWLHGTMLWLSGGRSYSGFYCYWPTTDDKPQPEDVIAWARAALLDFPAMPQEKEDAILALDEIAGQLLEYKQKILQGG